MPPETAAAAEQVFRALVDGSLQDMATGAAEVHCCSCSFPTWQVEGCFYLCPGALQPPRHGHLHRRGLNTANYNWWFGCCVGSLHHM